MASRTGTNRAEDSATSFSKATSSFRAAIPRAPLRSLAILSSTNSLFCILSCRTLLSARRVCNPSPLLTPSPRTEISFSSSSLDVALSTTSSRTLLPPTADDAASPPGSSSAL